MRRKGQTIVLKDGVRYLEVISRRFVCPQCNVFCIELVPIYERGLIRRMRRRGIDPVVKVSCRNGCNLSNPDWGFKTFDWASIQDVNSIREWPNWTQDAIAKKREREVRKRSG